VLPVGRDEGAEGWQRGQWEQVEGYKARNGEGAAV
jgi:hypothetical protein